MFFCPGCKCYHYVIVKAGNLPSPVWGWNGSMDKPTFTPSIRVSCGSPEGSVCHSFVRDGSIQYLDDCTHALKGQTVPLEVES